MAARIEIDAVCTYVPLPDGRILHYDVTYSQATGLVRIVSGNRTYLVHVSRVRWMRVKP
jgi:hypothetical protein